jgi:hypothetical protein
MLQFPNALRRALAWLSMKSSFAKLASKKNYKRKTLRLGHRRFRQWKASNPRWRFQILCANPRIQLILQFPNALRIALNSLELYGFPRIFSFSMLNHEGETSLQSGYSIDPEDMNARRARTSNLSAYRPEKGFSS